MASVSQQALIGSGKLLPATIAYHQSLLAPEANSSPTKTATLNLGPASADRYVVIVVNGYTDSSGPAKVVLSGTIGATPLGVISTETTTMAGPTYHSNVAILGAAFPAGTSGLVTVVFESGNSFYYATISSFSIRGLLSPTPFHISKWNGTAVQMDLPLNVKKDGVSIAITSTFYAPTTYNITGVNEVYDTGLGNIYWAGGMMDNTADESPRAISFIRTSGSGTPRYCGIAVSWR